MPAALRLFHITSMSIIEGLRCAFSFALFPTVPSESTQWGLRENSIRYGQNALTRAHFSRFDLMNED